MLILEELVAQKITQNILVEVIPIQGELVAQIITQEPLVEVILIQGELVAQIIIQEIQVEAMSILEEKMPFPCQLIFHRKSGRFDRDLFDLNMMHISNLKLHLLSYC